LRVEDVSNEMIRAALNVNEDYEFKHADEDETSISKKDLLERLKRHGKSLRKMKKCISFLHEKIMSTCNAVEGDNGQEADVECSLDEDAERVYEHNVQHFEKGDLSSGVTFKEDVAKGIDLNVAADVGCSKDVFALVHVMSCVSY